MFRVCRPAEELRVDVQTVNEPFTDLKESTVKQPLPEMTCCDDSWK